MAVGPRARIRTRWRITMKHSLALPAIGLAIAAQAAAAAAAAESAKPAESSTDSAAALAPPSARQDKPAEPPPEDDTEEPLVLKAQVDPEFPGGLMRNLRKGTVQVKFTVQAD